MSKTSHAKSGKNNKFIGITIVAVLLVIMIVSIVVLESLPQTPTRGVMDSEDMDAVSIQYTPEARKKFSAQFTAYINTIFEDYDTKIGSNIGLADLILQSMSYAKISTDKVVALGNYLEKKDASDFIKNVLLKYLGLDDFEEGDELPDDYFDDYVDGTADVNILLIILQEFNLPVVLSELVEETVITTEELGRICFYTFVQFTTGETQKEMLAFGADAFSAIFVDTYTIYEAFSLIQNGQVITRAEARVIRELLYEMGANYNKILAEFGQERIEALLGTDDPYQLPDTENYHEQINFMASSLYGIPTYILAFAGDYFTKLDSSLFDSLADYTASHSDKQLMYISMVSLIDAYESHMFALKEVDMTEQDLINKISYIFAGLDSIKGLAPLDPVEDGLLKKYQTEYIGRLTKLFGSLKTMYEKVDVNNPSQAYVDEMKQLIAESTVGLDSLMDGANKLSFILLYTALLGFVEGDGNGNNRS